MLKYKLQPIILAGGSGLRLWPLSRKNLPKQFLSLNDKSSLFQDTIMRLESFKHENPIIVCSEHNKFLVDKQLKSLNKNNNYILVEPSQKNTAPAITLAAFEALSSQTDPILMIMPSDHLIKNLKKFEDCLNKACEEAKKNQIVLLGVKPTRPSTDFGYIEVQKKSKLNGSYELKSFKEKPNLALAEKFIKLGCFFWNSGILLIKAKLLLEEMKKINPSIYSNVKDTHKTRFYDLSFVSFLNENFILSPEISIDHALLERTKRSIKVLDLNVGWNDLGSWENIWEESIKDENLNTKNKNVLSLESFKNYVYSKKKLVATLGIKDLIIINTDDAILVSTKKHLNKLKDLVGKIKITNQKMIEENLLTERPWGNYKIICEEKNYKVKKITISPGEKLSLQKHLLRSEHWVVVKGNVLVTKGDKTINLTVNESIYIPVDTVHRIENESNKEAIIIEVQSGTYLGEDDIIRLDDVYNREF